jgi:hypothetical protein
MKPLLSRRISPRTAIGAGVLVLAVSLIGWRGKPETHAYAAPVQRPASAPQMVAALDPDKLKRQAKNEAVGDLFPAPAVSLPGSAQPGQPEPPAAAPAAAPVAPPLPFRYLGKAVEESAITVFLARGDEHYQAKAGGRIGREYRVDRVTEKSVAFTYLPLGARQTLALPSSEPIVLE